MTGSMIIMGVVLLVCIFANKLFYRLGVPTLLVFLVLGILFGSDVTNVIYFDNYDLALKICSIALLFIMFQGGFSTNLKIAKPVIVPSILLSSLGVLITAALTGVFCHLVMRITLAQGFLIGAIVSSTDAASVFSILRSKKLNLKNNLASLLEVESGSNDPVAYMLTLTAIVWISGEAGGSIPIMLIKQILLGVLIGVLIGKGSAWILNKVNFEIEGLYPIFVGAIAVLTYAVCDIVGGNAYLAVYLTGLLLGNGKILHKRSLVRFFDGISWLMQILLFFSIGLLCSPSIFPSVLIPGILVSIFMILIARPAAVFGILSFFKIPIKQKFFVSWVGLRGAASIAFAILAVTYNLNIKNDIFHTVFLVALFSVALQGSMLPFMAKKLDLVENTSSVLKTFNDYADEVRMIEMTVEENSPWAGKTMAESGIPREMLVVMIKRKGKVIVPKGYTEILSGDVLVVSGNTFKGDSQTELIEIDLIKDSEWIGKRIQEVDIPEEVLVVMIKRKGNTIVPNGHTKLKEGDILVLSGCANEGECTQKI